MDDVLVRAVELPAADAGEERTGHPWDLPAVRALAGGVDLGVAVTYLIGENGSGKSTLLEAIAIAAGMNAEGGRCGSRGASSTPPSGISGHSSPTNRRRRVTSGCRTVDRQMERR